METETYNYTQKLSKLDMFVSLVNQGRSIKSAKKVSGVTYNLLVQAGIMLPEHNAAIKGKGV